MIQMLPKLHVPMAPRSDVKVALDLVRMHCSVQSTAIRLCPSRQSRGLRELLAVPRSAEIIMDILFPVFFWLVKVAPLLIFYPLLL